MRKYTQAHAKIASSHSLLLTIYKQQAELETLSRAVYTFR